MRCENPFDEQTRGAEKEACQGGFYNVKKVGYVSTPVLC